MPVDNTCFSWSSRSDNPHRPGPLRHSIRGPFQPRRQVHNKRERFWEHLHLGEPDRLPRADGRGGRPGAEGAGGERQGWGRQGREHKPSLGQEQGELEGERRDRRLEKGEREERGFGEEQQVRLRGGEDLLQVRDEGEVKGLLGIFIFYIVWVLHNIL